MEEMNNAMVDEVIENTVENVAEGTYDFKNLGFIGLGIAGTALLGLGIIKAGKWVAPKIAKTYDDFKNRKQKATDETALEDHTNANSYTIVDAEETNN